MNPWPGGIAVVSVLVLGGCTGGGPSVSGMPIAGSRVVSVGEIVEIKVPISENGSRQWRIKSFDSSYLAAVELSVREFASDGTPLIVHRTRAKKPGRTTVEFLEILDAQGVAEGRTPRTSTVSIRIVD